MPSFNKTIPVPGKTAQELYDKVSSSIDHLLTKGNLSFIGKFDLQRDPATQTVSFKASMASATLKCMDGVLQLDAQLSLLATPFKSKIEQAITHWTSKNLS